VLPVGIKAFRTAWAETLDAAQSTLTPLSEALFGKLSEELAKVDTEMAYYEDKLHRRATTHPESQRLLTIPGIGPLTATALLAAVSARLVKKPKRIFSPAFTDLPLPAQRLDFPLAMLHTQQA
jgi:transposase